jgi:hypothetical protein
MFFLICTEKKKEKKVNERRELNIQQLKKLNDRKEEKKTKKAV